MRIKKHKSTIDILYEIKQKFINSKIKGQILLDSTKAFGRIERKIMVDPLRKGIPTNLLKIIILGHADTKLCARHTGK